MVKVSRRHWDRQMVASTATGDSLPGTPTGRAVTEAIRKAQEYLLSRQSIDGYWIGELEADASVTAGYLPLMYFMQGAIDPERQRKVINQVRSRQNPDGSWSSYPSGPGDLNVSIQCYFALKLAGMPADEPGMQRACRFIRAKGGIGRASVFTKIWLAVFGQFPWAMTPSVPPEIIYLPNWFFFNIYDFASWSRETIMALAILLTTRPVCPVPEGAGVSELYLEPEGQRVYPLGRVERLFSWRTFFLVADRLFKLWERLPWQPGRQQALRRVARWVEEHQEADGSWGGIMLPWVYSLIALKSLGYPLEHPIIARGLWGLKGFIVEDAWTLRLQPATSPVWDTAWTVIALRESGLSADHPALRRAARWLLDHRITRGGDWQVKNPHARPGCWSFEFANDLYPDLDDTAVVPRALQRVQLTPSEEEEKAEAIATAVDWILSMQGSDGGWAAFDRDNNKRFLAYVPFADFMSPLDPTCADVTAHILELLGELGATGGNVGSEQGPASAGDPSPTPLPRQRGRGPISLSLRSSGADRLRNSRTRCRFAGAAPSLDPFPACRGEGESPSWGCWRAAKPPANTPMGEMPRGGGHPPEQERHGSREPGCRPLNLSPGAGGETGTRPSPAPGHDRGSSRTPPTCPLLEWPSMGLGTSAVKRALAYLERTQEADGAWYGRWGVNYLYGTGLALAGLAAVGRGAGEAVQRAVAWLAFRQNPDGGWGESCQSYDDPLLRGSGPSTPSQTAWALLGLIAAGERSSPAVERGIRYLLETQGRDGQWKEEAFTGTGFPRAFYLRYDYYRIYFPLLALGRYAVMRET